MLLAACVPATRVPADPPLLPGASGAATVPFGPYQSYYEKVGRSGYAVLMVHGIGGGSSLFQYRNNAPALADAAYEVYALDLLGFGGSSRPNIRYTQELHVAQIIDFIETTIREPTVLVANGLSAAYSIRVAAERPDLVSALVLSVPTGYDRLARPQNDDRVAQFERFRGIVGDLLYGALLGQDVQRIFLLDAYAERSNVTEDVVRSYDRNLRVPGARWVVFSFISGNLDQDVSDYWPEVTQPSLIVWGAEAETTPPEDAEAFLAARPQTTLVTLGGAKLLPNVERAEAFNEAVIRFLARRLARAAP